jgi:hypothetical protein
MLRIGKQMRCANCGYEVDEVDANTELCQTCKSAYDLGWQAYADSAYWDSCDSCGSYSANKVTLGDGSEVPLCDECVNEGETK